MDQPAKDQGTARASFCCCGHAEDKGSSAGPQSPGVHFGDGGSDGGGFGFARPDRRGRWRRRKARSGGRRPLAR